MRDYWLGEPATLDEFASRLTGSADLYEHTARRPVASINFMTCHDGFTLRDLVSYNEKHNDANGEDNRDGERHNRSWNCGVEGPTDDPAVNELRARQQRNFLATTQLPQGVPVISHGDELARTQGGNNNGFCQDNDVTWIHWDKADTALVVHPDGVRAAYRASGVPPPPVLHRAARAPARHRGTAGHLMVSARRIGDERRRLGGRLRQVNRGLSERAWDCRPRGARAAGHRRLLRALLQRPRRGTPIHLATS